MSKEHLITSAELIYQIGQLEGQVIQKQLINIDLRMDHARLLHYVSNEPGTNQINLANYLNIQPASLTNMIKKLEKQDLIVRRVNPSDSHQKQVFLLPKGEKIAQKINDTFHFLNQLVESADLTNLIGLQKLSKMLSNKLKEQV
ncbi:MarR family winged helix-turn-helix transcriptional regulator [Companilactobacillus keshanensis]|uniref:MarR family winged helix-turn-helix transcriptional regulator n=1 Tax=Companilactobacillus keshanensis TaxID=2486003 RepID=A0ABW4BWS7_9LACO|nr:MarR family transcriptional regulator [Companilactobacillus keshanensis]